jgi:hypothetical protein
VAGAASPLVEAIGAATEVGAEGTRRTDCGGKDCMGAIGHDMIERGLVWGMMGTQRALVFTTMAMLVLQRLSAYVLVREGWLPSCTGLARA